MREIEIEIRPADGAGILTTDAARPRGLRIADVVARDISMAALRAAVESAEHGAVVTFEGVVRDHDDGESVDWLRYSAHPSAAIVMREVAAEVAERFAPVAIAVEHRTGPLVIGGLALGCAVASAHRAEAFAACAALVDEVKARVPIWKEQGFSDGHTEWVAALG